MSTFTPEQEAALERIYHRDLNRVVSNTQWYREHHDEIPFVGSMIATWDSLEHCRASAVTCFGCIMIKAGSIWLGIEPDGYTHS